MDGDFFSRVITELEPIMGQSIVPIMVCDQHGSARVHGTGTLFQIADQHFLVTAAHVFASAKKHFANQLFMSDYKEQSDFVPLDGCCVHHYTHEAIDVAIFELTDSVLAAIRHRTFLNFGNVDFSPDSSQGYYYIYGWPTELSGEDAAKKLVTAEQFQFITQIYSGNVPEGIMYDPQIHVLLNLPHESGGSKRLLNSEVARPRNKRLQYVEGV